MNKFFVQLDNVLLICCIIQIGSGWVLEDAPVTQEAYDNFANDQYPTTDFIAQKYDFIIVGAGTAGCILANRLSENSVWTILLLEAGGVESLDMDIPGYSPNLKFTSMDWQYYSEPLEQCGSGLRNRSIYIPRGKVLGGSSAINGMVYTRGPSRDFDLWHASGSKNWRLKDIEPYYKKLENYTVKTADAELFGHNGPMHVTENDFISPTAQTWLQAAEKTGLKYINYNSDKSQIGVSRTQGMVKDNYRMSTNRAYLMPLKNKRINLTLATGCFVTKIIISDLKATGIEFSMNGQQWNVSATKEVILAAGCYNTPKLLMLSGIGPRSHLKSKGIKVIKNLPVGKNLAEHVHPSGIIFTTNLTKPDPNAYDEFKYNQSGTLGCVTEVIGFTRPVFSIQTVEIMYKTPSFLDSPSLIRAYDLNKETAEMYTNANLSNVYSLSFYSILLKPKSRGIVTLRDTDPFAAPSIQLNFYDDPQDIEMSLAALKEGLKIFEQDVWKKYDLKLFDTPIPPCKKYKFGSDSYWRCHIKALASPFNHPIGTAKMGRWGDPNAVVDNMGKVFGVRSLRVVDASVIPLPVSGHTCAPVMMVAEKLSDAIKNNYR